MTGERGSPISSRYRELRRMNRRLRWKKGAFRICRIAGATPYEARRDTVVRLLQQREWRLALIVTLLPKDYALEERGYDGAR